MTTQAVPPPIPNTPRQQCYPSTRNRSLSPVNLVWVANKMYEPECICTRELIKFGIWDCLHGGCKDLSRFLFFGDLLSYMVVSIEVDCDPAWSMISCLLFCGPPLAFPGFLCLIHHYFQGSKESCLRSCSHCYQRAAREKGRKTSNLTWPLLTGRELTCWAASVASLAWSVPSEKGICVYRAWPNLKPRSGEGTNVQRCLDGQLPSWMAQRPRVEPNTTDKNK